MPVNIPRLRWWFAAAAIVLIAVVAGFYFYARYRVGRAITDIPKNLGVNIQQSTSGFTFSKSEGGRTLFTVHASQAVQYKEGGRALLKDVKIIVYGREANRYDQIYGSDFEYDPNAGTIAAKGEVHIDLEGNAEGPLHPDQAQPQELKNPIHVKTSGLVFNRNSGVAETKERLEFRVPQASGSAMGAMYDSRAATLTLDHAIHIHGNAPHEADLVAQHGVITKGPNRVVLDGVNIDRPTGNFSAGHLTVFLRDDNTVERMVATGNVKAHESGRTVLDASAARAEAIVNENDHLRTATMSGEVALQASGADNVQGSAGKLLFTFTGRNQLERVTASDNVRLLQQPPKNSTGRPVELTAAGLYLDVRNGHEFHEAVTSGAARVTVLPQTGGKGEAATRTVATAGEFRARFQRNRLVSVTGTPDARVVSTAPGEPDKVSTSQRLQVGFTAAGGIGELVQEGNFHYVENVSDGKREAWSDKATYTAGGGATLKLSGSPRVVEGGMTTTADSVQLDRATGDATARGNVKTTYSDLKPQAGGALLASGDPIHVTGTSMTARRSSATARYQDARLWQGANVVQAPSLEFDRDARKLVASGEPSHRITTVFVETDKAGKVTPINVTAARLVYTDQQRQARFEGGVIMKGADTTITAKRLDIYLHARPPGAASGPSPGPSQLEKAVASGDVVIQNSARRATGESLTYLAAEGKFVLTGGPPSIFDAEHGKITGDSLTFFQRDDRVLVESSNTPTVTRTRVAK